MTPLFLALLDLGYTPLKCVLETSGLSRLCNEDVKRCRIAGWLVWVGDAALKLAAGGVRSVYLSALVLA